MQVSLDPRSAGRSIAQTATTEQITELAQQISEWVAEDYLDAEIIMALIENVRKRNGEKAVQHLKDRVGL